jgi:hypothetical protein
MLSIFTVMLQLFYIKQLNHSGNPIVIVYNWPT